MSFAYGIAMQDGVMSQWHKPDPLRLCSLFGSLLLGETSHGHTTERVLRLFDFILAEVCAHVHFDIAPRSCGLRVIVTHPLNLDECTHL